jgi:hypothetical protein
MSIKSVIDSYEERLRVAQLKSDIDELSILLDDTLVFSALDGSVVGKMDDLNLHKSSQFRISKIDLIERKIQCYKNAAVVNALMDVSAEIGGVTQSNKLRYIRVWYRFHNGWRIISGSMRAE